MRVMRGFTLIELLVVMGIIGLLIAILLPTLSRVRKAAQATVCLSNLRQMGMGWLSYANESKGRPHPSSWATIHYPPTGQTGWFINPPINSTGGATHDYFIGKYLGNSNDVYQCPSVSDSPLSAGFSVGSESLPWAPDNFSNTGQPGAPKLGTYAYNSWLSDSALFRVGFLEGQLFGGGFVQKVTQIRGSSNFPIYSDGKWLETGLILDTNPLPSREAQMALTPGLIITNEFMTQVAMQRHAGGINVAMADGSARYVPIRELWSLQWSRVFKTRPTY